MEILWKYSPLQKNSTHDDNNANIFTKLTKNLSWLELSPIVNFIAEIFTFAENFQNEQCEY